MTEDSFLPYARQSIQDEDIEAMHQAMKGDMITRGPNVEKFEEAFAHSCSAEYAVAFNSGTSALFAACQAVHLNAYDHVFTTPNTFVATVSAPMQFGAKISFVDIEPSTGNLSLEQLYQAMSQTVSSRGRKILMPVHFAGIPVDMKTLVTTITDPKTVIIEDAAHAIGSNYPTGEPVGSCAYSDMTVFSLHPSKTITAGEGGVATTNDPELADKLRVLRNSGMVRQKSFPKGYYEVVERSGNFNFTDFQAALALSQLGRLGSFVEKRRQLIAIYREELTLFPNLLLFSDEHDPYTAYHLMVAQIDFAAFKTTREEVMGALEKVGIGTQVHYIPIYRHPFYKALHGDLRIWFPETEKYYSQALTLPLFYDLLPEQVVRVCRNLKDILGSASLLTPLKGPPV